MVTDEQMHAYYERDRERDRLATGRGELEFIRTIEIMQRTLPRSPAAIADIGGGPGRYTDWLIAQGHNVAHRDIVPDHVEQVRQRHSSVVDAAVGDARDLSDFDDASLDAVLLLGPLYHLTELADRVQVLKEAARVTKRGGMIYAACISRWGARMGMLVERQYLEYPQILDAIDVIDATGVMEPIVDGGFNGYTHTPDQFRSEMAIDELELLSVLALEGAASAFADEDVANRLADPVHRKVLLDSLRALEATPDLLGVSAHILATAVRR